MPVSQPIDELAKEPSPAPKKSGLNARVVWSAVRRHPWILAGIFALSLMAGAGVWFFLPLPKETASIVFHIASKSPSILFTNVGGDDDAALLSYKQSQAAIVKRRLTLAAALKEPGIGDLAVIRMATPDPVSWMDQRIKVDARGNSEFMRLTLEGDNGEELRRILSAVGKVYLAEVDERHNGQKRRRLEKLEEMRRGYQAELDRFNNRIDAIAAVLTSKDGPTLATMDSILQGDLREAARERNRVREELRLAESELASLDNAIPGREPAETLPFGALAGGAGAILASDLVVDRLQLTAVPDSMIDELLRNDPALRAHELAVENARQNLTKTQALFQPGTLTPAVKRAKEELSAAEAKRDSYRIARRPELELQAKQNLRQNESARKTVLAQNIERLRRRDEVAQEKLREIEDQIGRKSQYRRDLETLKQSIAQTEKLNEQMAGEIERIKVELSSSARVTLAEEAFVLPGIEGNRRLKYTMMTSVGILVVGFGCIVGWEIRSRRVTHPDDITRELGIQLLGTIPPPIPAASPLPADVAQSLMIESVDTARTMLIHGAACGKQVRTLLITSAVSGEGKTSLSGHLAISLARAGYTTLLIDADFQAPSAYELYGLSPGKGFCELLRGESRLDEAIHLLPVPGLSILPTGNWSLAAGQALSDSRWSTLRKDLEGRFDFIVIDSAPLLLVADTLQLARSVDAVLLSVLNRESTISHAREAINRLVSIGANLCGAILNGVFPGATLRNYRYRGQERRAVFVERPENLQQVSTSDNGVGA